MDSDKDEISCPEFYSGDENCESMITDTEKIKTSDKLFEEELENLKNASKILGFTVHNTNKLRSVDENHLDDVFNSYFGPQQKNTNVTVEDIEQSMSEIDIENQLKNGATLESIKSSVKYSSQFNSKIREQEKKWKDEEEEITLDHVFDNLEKAKDDVTVQKIVSSIDKTSGILSDTIVVFMSSTHKSILSKISDEIFSKLTNMKTGNIELTIFKSSISSILTNITDSIFDIKSQTNPNEYSSDKNIFISSLLLRSMYTGFEISGSDEITRGEEFEKDIRLKHNKKKIDLSLFPVDVKSLESKIYDGMVSMFGDNFWDVQLLKDVIKKNDVNQSSKPIKSSDIPKKTKTLVFVDDIKSKTEIEIISTHGATCLYIYIDALTNFVKDEEFERFAFGDQGININDAVKITEDLDKYILIDIMKFEKKGKLFKRKVPKIENYDQWITGEIKRCTTPTELTETPFLHLKKSITSRNINWDDWKQIYIKHYMRENYSSEFWEYNKKNKCNILYNRVLLQNSSDEQDVYNINGTKIVNWIQKICFE